jgi:hypothetical protein
MTMMLVGAKCPHYFPREKHNGIAVAQIYSLMHLMSFLGYCTTSIRTNVDYSGL